MDIQKIVATKVNEMVVSGDLEKQIQNGVEKSIKIAIDDMFKEYGDFTKSMKGVISATVSINPEDLDIPSYNQQMLVAVRTKLGNLFAGQAVEKFNSEIDKLLSPAPNEITITDLVSNICALWRDEYEEYEKDNWYEHAHVELTEEGGVLRGSFSLKMSRSSDRDQAIHLYISEHSSAIRISHNFYYNPTCFDAVDAYIFKLYAAKTCVIGFDNFNEGAIDTSVRKESWGDE